jgi:hypothetical protein
MPKFRKGFGGAAMENKALRWITPSYGELRWEKIPAVRALAIREIQGDFDQNKPNST